MVQDYSLIFKTYQRLQNKRRVTEMLLARMKDVVLAAGGKLTITLFDMTPEERAAYRSNRSISPSSIATIPKGAI